MAAPAGSRICWDTAGALLKVSSAAIEANLIWDICMHTQSSWAAAVLDPDQCTATIFCAGKRPRAWELAN
jgi:hypothetical protein